MNYFFIISLLLIGYYVCMVLRRPTSWLSYLHIVPAIVFMTYARLGDMEDTVWVGAFELAGIVAAMVIAILWHQRVVMDRIMLGLNIFFILGAGGFLFDIDTILDWYGRTKGAPLFSCIAAVGLISTISSSRGFVGVFSKKKEAVTYTSFLLLAVTFIALVWSVSADAHGLLWAVILPFVVLKVLRDQLAHHLL